MIKCIIIDDEQHAVDVIASHIAKIPELELVGSATDPLTGLALIREKGADAVFLDIDMDTMSGIELAQHLDPKTKVVFCTAFSEFAVKSYELRAVDYLLKPILFNRFYNAVQHLKESLQMGDAEILDIDDDDHIFIHDQRGKMVKVDMEEIQYVKGDGNYINFQLIGRPMLSGSTLNEVEKKLSPRKFARIHRSYIVALKRVDRYEYGHIVLIGDKEKIKLSGKYKKAFFERMKNKLF